MKPSEVQHQMSRSDEEWVGKFIIILNFSIQYLDFMHCIYST